MVPVTAMVAFNIRASQDVIIKTISLENFSRYPVYDRDKSDIKGILYNKDVFNELAYRREISIPKILHNALFVPETMKISSLMREMQKKRQHMAIVIDEYGGVTGLVTIEDLIEEIVGEIQDEYDTEEELIQLQPDGSAVVDARVPIEEFEQLFDIEVERDKFDTVGGLIFSLLGRIPRTGDEVSTAGIRLTVLSAGERRIGKLRAERVVPAVKAAVAP